MRILARCALVSPAADNAQRVVFAYEIKHEENAHYELLPCSMQVIVGADDHKNKFIEGHTYAIHITEHHATHKNKDEEELNE